jgi:hypothetical protein
MTAHNKFVHTKVGQKKTVDPNEEVHTSTLRLPVSLWQRINHLAIDKRLSMTQAIMFAIEEYCDRAEKKA